MKSTIFESELINYWDWTKNELLDPKKISIGSHTKVFWICKNKHSYLSPIYRQAAKISCPYCSKRKILSGYNDFETMCKNKHRDYLLKEWDFTKNALDISCISANSSQKVWWICPIGHSYQSRIDNRFYGRNCPICLKESRTSFPEQTIFYYVKKFFPDAVNSYSTDEISEIDIYIPSKKIGFEYDGLRWHSSVKKQKMDARKDSIVKTKGIKLFRIKESYEKETIFLENNNINFYINHSYKYLSDLIELILDLLGINNFTCDIENDRPRIYAQYIESLKKNNLVIKYPELIKSWNYEKNEGLCPENFSAASNKIVWWKCSKGHEWQVAICERTLRKYGCPYCSGRRVLSGYNDLFTVAPDLMKEWNYEKNKKSPREITQCHRGKVWWKCEKGHEWQAAVYSRYLENVGCPYCKNRIIVSGMNDLATLKPELIKEWDYSKNKIDPTKIGAGYSKKVWWKCSKGHEWQNTVVHRSNGQNCPFCKMKRVIQIKNNEIIAVFNSIGQASKETGTSKGGISNCCIGRQKTAGGFNWKYE